LDLGQAACRGPLPKWLVEFELSSYSAIVQEASDVDCKTDGSICYRMFDVALDARAVRERKRRAAECPQPCGRCLSLQKREIVDITRRSHGTIVL